MYILTADDSPLSMQRRSAISILRRILLVFQGRQRLFFPAVCKSASPFSTLGNAGALMFCGNVRGGSTCVVGLREICTSSEADRKVYF